MMPLDPQHFVDCIALNVGGEMSDERFREFVETCLELYKVSPVVVERLKTLGRTRTYNHEPERETITNANGHELMKYY